MRSPVFFQSKVERLDRAGDFPAIVAVLPDHSDKMYERAHAAKALADQAGRLGDIREQAVAVLMLAADEPTAMRAFRRAATDGNWMIRIFAAHGFDRLGSRARPLLERAAMTDPYPWVREAARDALERFRH